jgi:hypothetical protein
MGGCGMSENAVSEPSYLHLSSWAGHFAYPVVVLSRGKRFARVRLLHKTRIGRVTYPRGTVKHRVPLDSLSDYPSSLAYVSQGGGRFK